MVNSKVFRFWARWVWLIVAGITVSNSTYAQVTTIVTEGSPTPVGGTFGELEHFSSNDNGAIVFPALVGGAGGVFFATPGSTSVVVGDGDNIAGIGQLSLLAGSRIALNEQNVVAFTGNTSQGEGIFIKDGQNITKVMLPGETTPFGGTFANNPDIRPKSLNNSGALAFESLVISGNAAPNAIFLFANGVLSGISMQGQQTPIGGTYSEVNFIAINDADSVLFSAEITGASANEALFIYHNGTVSNVVATGDSAPENKIYAVGSATDESLGSINNKGEIVFAGSIGDPSTQTGEFAIFRVSAGTITPVVTQSDPVPGGGSFTLFIAPTIDENGQVAFLSVINGFSGPWGLFVAADGQTEKIALEGEASPIGGTFSDLVTFGLPKINAGGLVAFNGKITGGSANSALFLWGGPLLSVSPDTVFFETVAIGETDTKDVTITSVGSDPLEIQNITAAPTPPFGLENLPALPLTLQPGDKITFAATFTPEQNAASTNGQLTIESNAATGTKVVDLIEPVVVSDLEIVVDPAEIKASQFSTILVKALDQKGNVNTDYFGNVRFKLLLDENGNGVREIRNKESTAGIGRLNTGISLVDEGVSENIFLFTPEEQFSADPNVITSQTVLAGTAFIAIELEDPVLRDTIQVNVKSPLDFFIEKIEIQQGVRDTDMDVFTEFQGGVGKIFPALPFIAEHKTTVSVFVDYQATVPIDIASVELPGISGELGVSLNGTEITRISEMQAGWKQAELAEYVLKDTNGDGEVDEQDYEQSERLNLKDVLFAAFDYTQMQIPGNYTFDAELRLDSNLAETASEQENNRMLAGASFVQTRPMRILTYVGFLQGAGVVRTISEDVLDFSKNAYPVQFSGLKFSDLNRRPKGFKSGFIFSAATLSDINDLLNSHNKENPNDQYDVVIMFAQQDLIDEVCGEGTGGCASRGGKAGITIWFSGSTLAHEFGHILGLRDTYKTDKWETDDGPPNPRRSNAVDNGNFVELGNAQSIDSVRTSQANPYFDFMGSGSSWVDRVTWDHLYRTNFQVSSPIVLKSESSNGFVAVSGIIDNSGNVTFKPLLKLDQAPSVDESVTGDYSLDFEDQAGSLLSSFNFDVDFHIPEVGDVTEVPFSYYLPLPVGTAKVMMKNNGVDIAERTFSANSPTVQLISPTDGASITGTSTITWSASDTDGDSLVYTILYSPDGQEQLIVDAGIIETSFTWDANLFPTSESGSITVVANDGINEGRATAINLKIGTGETLSPPINLMATVAGDSVFLDWDSPAQGTSLLAKYSGPYRPKSAIQNAQRKRPAKPFNSPIKMLTAATDIDEIEPNNNPQQAQVLSGESPLVVNGQVEISDVGDVVPELFGDDLEDLFKVTLTQPGLTIRLDQFTSDCDLYLLNADASQELDNSTNIGATDPEAIDSPQLPAGTYLIGVTIFDEDPIGPDSTSYRLTLEGSFDSGGESSVVSFNIYRSPTPGARATGALINSVNSNTTTFLDVAPGGPEHYYQVTAVYQAGESPPSNEVRAVVTSISELLSELPRKFALWQNFPNPFNPQTNIRYDIPVAGRVRVDIFNLRGQRISTLVDEQKPAGSYSVTWDGRTENGDSAASGIYIYRLKTEQFESTRKLILLR